MVTRYCVFAAKVAFGLRIHWFVVPFRVTVAAMAVPGAATLRRKNVVVVTPVMASLNVAVMLLARTTPGAFAAGVVVVMVGAGPVRKVQLVLASGLPATSRIAVAPPTSRAV